MSVLLQNAINVLQMAMCNWLVELVVIQQTVELERDLFDCVEVLQVFIAVVSHSLLSVEDQRSARS